MSHGRPGRARLRNAGCGDRVLMRQLVIPEQSGSAIRAFLVCVRASVQQRQRSSSFLLGFRRNASTARKQRMQEARRQSLRALKTYGSDLRQLSAVPSGGRRRGSQKKRPLGSPTRTWPGHLFFLLARPVGGEQKKLAAPADYRHGLLALAASQGKMWGKNFLGKDEDANAWPTGVLTLPVAGRSLGGAHIPPDRSPPRCS